MTRRIDESGKEATRAGNKLDELKRENHRLKNQMEDVMREKVWTTLAEVALRMTCWEADDDDVTLLAWAVPLRDLP